MSLALKTCWFIAYIIEFGKRNWGRYDSKLIYNKYYKLGNLFDCII